MSYMFAVFCSMTYRLLWLKTTRLYLYIYLYQEEHLLYVIKGPKVEHQYIKNYFK